MLRFSVVGMALMATCSFAQTNPIQVSASTFKGYRTSSNTQTVRDLGFMGNVGNTWILSFGDGVGTTNVATYNQSVPAGQPNGECAYITARDGGGIQSSNMLSYADITVITNVGACGSVPQMGYFCPLLPQEQSGQGLGITNVMQVNSTYGCIWTRPTISPSNGTSNGAGLALVSLDASGNPTCTRPFGKSTWTNNEPDWGQLSALNGNDGYTYVFANGYDGNINSQNGNVVLARAPTASVFNLASYQYWDGSGFTSSRILISQLSATSPENLVGLNSTSQGSAFYSTYYQKFIYIACGRTFYDDGDVYAWTATAPQGPWSSPVIVYTDSQPSPSQGPSGLDYGGFIMPKFTSSDGKTIYFSYTRANYEAVVEVNFM